jgi:tetratricopeptide (TPR) repeat protein
MSRALIILKTIAGENHPDIASLYLNTGLMLKDMDRIPEAVNYYKRSLHASVELFGEEHVQVANTYQAIAQAYYQMYEFRVALEHQQKAYKLLQGLYKDENHHYLKQAKLQLDQYLKFSVHSEKLKMAQRTIGSNKAPAGPASQQELAQKQQRLWM